MYRLSPPCRCHCAGVIRLRAPAGDQSGAQHSAAERVQQEETAKGTMLESVCGFSHAAQRQHRNEGLCTVQSLGKQRLLCITAPGSSGHSAAGALHMCKEVQGKFQVSPRNHPGGGLSSCRPTSITGVGACRSVKPCLLLI